MITNSRVTLGWPAVVIAVIALLAAGAGAAYLLMQNVSGPGPRMQGLAGPANAPPTAQAPQSSASGAGTTDLSLPDVVVTLSPEATKRAGIELVSATRGAAGSSVFRIAGTVESNAYKQVVVTPLVAGRVTRVLVELGDRVQSGQTLMQIFSPELADAQTKYLSAKAEFEAHEQELARTSRLLAIGAASQQETERVHAEHAAKLAEVQSLRSRLVLLGMSAAAIEALSPGKEIEATTDIPAPIDGVITERAANVGLNVDTATKVFTVVDLTSVWVVGALYERDLSRVRVGSAASVTTAADPGLARQGRVSYIDPQVTRGHTHGARSGGSAEPASGAATWDVRGHRGRCNREQAGRDGPTQRGAERGRPSGGVRGQSVRDRNVYRARGASWRRVRGAGRGCVGRASGRSGCVQRQFLCPGRTRAPRAAARRQHTRCWRGSPLTTNLQPCVFDLGLLQDRNVEVSIVPEGEEILVDRG